jgi:hypothetical protein
MTRFAGQMRTILVITKVKMRKSVARGVTFVYVSTKMGVIGLNATMFIPLVNMPKKNKVTITHQYLVTFGSNST